jgi:hypothetical protein
MKTICTAVLLALSSGVAHASDIVGVYSLISSVTFEPNADHPQRIVVSGVFAMSKPQEQRASFSDDYLPPQRGYLYFTLPTDARQAEMVLKEWTDIKAVAGTGKPIAFGGRDQFRTLHVRPPGEKLSAPDVYQLQIGVTRVRSDTDYAPIKAILAFHS